MKLFLILLMLTAVLSVSAGELTVTIPIDRSSIDIEEVGPYTRITGEGMRLMSKEGLPSLPVETARIALPTGCTATSIEIIDAVYTSERGRYTVMPAGPRVPLSVDEEIYSVEPNLEIYAGSEVFPSAPVTFRGSSVILGIPVAYTNVYPVRWNPQDKTLDILSSVTILVTYENTGEASTVNNRSIQSENRSMDIVRASVVNPLDVAGSGANIISSRDLTYGEYVIIATSTYETYAQELADWKTEKGIPTKVYTTTWIQSQYSCYDLQQEIRAFLTDCRDEGVEYVLIFGDDNIIAGRDVKITYSSYTEYPCVDLYWADINDSGPGADLWDFDGDHVWGEYYDDLLDYHPDLWVGRASVNSTSEAALFNDKVFIYEGIQAASDYFDTAPREMRIGYSTELLWGWPYNCYGSAGAELISPWVPSGWEEEKCYDSWGANSPSITTAMINDMPHHLYHASHGSQTYFSLPGGYYGNSDILAQTNISSGGLPAIFNSISCLIGQLDGYECMADAWLASPNGGGFCMFNARYGWGSPDNPGYGPSEVLSRYFYDCMWNDDLYNLGVAHAMAQDAISPPADECDDWCVKEWNLFGDPEMPMWYDEAENLSVTHPSDINGITNVSVTVTSGGSPVSGAVVCLQKGDWQTGEVYEIGTTNASGQVTIYVEPTSTGNMSIAVTSRDCTPYRGTITVSGVGIEESTSGDIFVNSINSVHPSPAITSTAIPFTLSTAGNVQVDIFDITGRIVTTLAAEEMAAGNHSLVWNLTDENGTQVPSGIYQVRVTSGNWTGTTSLVVAN